MSKYKTNPKTKGSGIVCAIPQKGRCPQGCEDCFFQSGRSFLEPLDENTPNMPDMKDMFLYDKVVRVNDGNDSNNNQRLVISKTRYFPMKFYNTSIPNDLENFDAPVVLTINPGKMTDTKWNKIDPIPKNLMFVRIRSNLWNLASVVYPAVVYYTENEVPIVLTFMAYFDTQDKIPERYRKGYVFRKRTVNSYNAITTASWENVMSLFKYNKYVDSCGKIEGEKGDTHCRFCGNCLKHYFATIERMRGSEL